MTDSRKRLALGVGAVLQHDPEILLVGGDALDREVDDVLAKFGQGPLIFNLGHGILPNTPIVHVERMLKRVRGSA